MGNPESGGEPAEATSEPVHERLQRRIIDVRGALDRLEDHSLRQVVDRSLSVAADLLGAKSAVFVEALYGDGVDLNLRKFDHEIGPNIGEAFLVQLADDLDNLETGLEMAASDAPSGIRQKVLDAVAALLEGVVREVDAIRSRYRTLRPLEAREAIDETLRRLGEKAREAFETCESLGTSVVFAEAASAAAAEAQHSAQLAKEAAGATSEAALSAHFEELAGGGLRRGLFWLLTTLILLVVYIIAGYVFLLEAAELSLSAVLRRLGVVIPMLVMVGLTAREATINRNHGLWARHLAVQLKSVEAFIDRLDREEQQGFLEHFGRIVFAGPPSFAFPRQRTFDRTHEPAVPLAELEVLLEGLVRASRREGSGG